MEFYRRNWINTTSVLSASSANSLTTYLFDRDRALQWQSDGEDDDANTATIEVTFDETTTVDRLAILNHNFKAFRMTYNGGTDFDPTISSTNNSETSSLYKPTSVNATSVQLHIDSTIVADEEKALGQLIVSKLELDLEASDRDPDAASYKPVKKRKEVLLEMSDGGFAQYVIDDKRQYQIKYSFLNTATVESLEAIYDAKKEFLFVPFGTISSWDAVIPEVIWTGDWMFDEFSDNNQGAGYTGKMDLKETAD